jgi:hypothetical protein
LRIEVDEVQSLYESVLAEMRREAIILDFLPIFAVRKVKEKLLPHGTAAGTQEKEPRPDRSREKGG